MSTVGQRLEELMRRLGGISANELGRRCGGIPGQTITNIIRASDGNPTYMPRASTLAKIVEGTGVSLLWLEHGMGSPDDRPGASISPSPEAPALTESAGPEVVALESELFRTMNRRRYLLEDFDETRKALRAHFPLLQGHGAALAVAQLWLEAVYQLRRRGQPINISTIPARASIDAMGPPPEAPSDGEGDGEMVEGGVESGTRHKPFDKTG